MFTFLARSQLFEAPLMTSEETVWKLLTANKRFLKLLEMHCIASAFYFDSSAQLLSASYDNVDRYC